MKFGIEGCELPQPTMHFQFGQIRALEEQI